MDPLRHWLVPASSDGDALGALLVGIAIGIGSASAWPQLQCLLAILAGP